MELLDTPREIDWVDALIRAGVGICARICDGVWACGCAVALAFDAEEPALVLVEPAPAVVESVAAFADGAGEAASVAAAVRVVDAVTPAADTFFSPE